MKILKDEAFEGMKILKDEASEGDVRS